MRQGSQHEPVAWRTSAFPFFINIIGDGDYAGLFVSIARSKPGKTYFVVLRNGQKVTVRRK